MASTNYYKTINHSRSLTRRHPVVYPPSSLSVSSFNPKKLTITTLTANPLTTCSISSTTSTTPTTTLSTSDDGTISYELLEQHLSAKNFREADDETRRLLIVLAGEPARKRGYVFFSEVKFIADEDLKTIDDLWLKYSDGKFGYSVQKKIWNKVNQDFTRYFIKVGWMKKLDTEVLQYNYRAFPTEFIWELNDETPEGHLPLTNALRGTQLLNCVLSHSAFKNDEVEDEDKDDISGNDNNSSSSKPLFKTNYSF